MISVERSTIQSGTKTTQKITEMTGEEKIQYIESRLKQYKSLNKKADNKIRKGGKEKEEANGILEEMAPLFETLQIDAPIEDDTFKEELSEPQAKHIEHHQ